MQTESLGIPNGWRNLADLGLLKMLGSRLSAQLSECLNCIPYMKPISNIVY
jgi:hypothetical protein